MAENYDIGPFDGQFSKPYSEGREGVVFEDPTPPDDTSTPEIPKPPPAPKVEVDTLEDGSTITYTQDATGHHAKLTIAGGGGKQIFHANTRKELNHKLCIAQINATKKIRDQNRALRAEEILLPTQQSVPIPDVSAPATPAGISADAAQALKVKFAVDPAGAMDAYFKLRFGREPEQLTAQIDAGAEAHEALQVEAECSAFINSHPLYYAVQKNFNMLMRYLQGHNLSLTAQNLSLAYDTLQSAGLLEDKPIEVDDDTTVVDDDDSDDVNTPPAAPPQQTVEPNQRIAGIKRQPRASYGLRGQDTTNVPPVAESKALTDEEIRKLPADELQKLMEDSRKYFAATRRS